MGIKIRNLRHENEIYGSSRLIANLVQAALPGSALYYLTEDKKYVVMHQDREISTRSRDRLGAWRSALSFVNKTKTWKQINKTKGLL